MIEFKAYHELFRDQEYLSESRILFEATNFDIYVWITDDHLIRAFQIGWNDQFYLQYRDGKQIQCFKKTDEPFLRCLTGEVEQQILDSFIAKSVEYICEEFSSAFAIVKQLVKGCKPSTLQLSKSEIEAINKMRVADCRPK